MNTTVITAAAVLFMAGAAVSAARADGPRPASGNNWRGMASAETPYTTTAAPPHYEWQEGYDHGGKWHGHWVVVR
jgi:hypothetical protein